MKTKSRLDEQSAKAMLLALVHSAVWAIGMASLPPVAAQPAAVPKAAMAPEFRLGGDRVTLRFVMVREFPFVEGSVEGVQGKFMLDTGLESALAINDRRVAIDSVAVGSGQFGSGQKFAVRQAPVVKDLHLPGLAYPRITTVSTQDATQLERITPDFIGWLGFYLWEGYALKLDYRQLQATFYRGAPAEYLAGEQVIAALPFSTRKAPQIPIMQVKIGDIDATGIFDTGAYGLLFTDVQSRDRLIDSGMLKPAGNDKYDLSGLKIGDTSLPDLKGITVQTVAFPAAEQTGLNDKRVLILGYAFLNNYKTVWDYPGKTMYLLQK
jgi:hypothetical protein